jgi:hypothetical protein
VAGRLDEQMAGKAIHAPTVPIDQLPIRSGVEVARELGGRSLLRYVTPNLVHEPDGSRVGQPTFVTPTPYAPQDPSHFLELPMPHVARPYVIFLDPSQIDRIAGPQYVGPGLGLQYVLPDGYDAEAVMAPGWAHEVR